MAWFSEDLSTAISITFHISPLEISGRCSSTLYFSLVLFKSESKREGKHLSPCVTKTGASNFTTFVLTLPYCTPYPHLPYLHGLFQAECSARFPSHEPACYGWETAFRLTSLHAPVPSITWSYHSVCHSMSLENSNGKTQSGRGVYVFWISNKTKKRKLTQNRAWVAPPTEMGDIPPCNVGVI